MANSVVSNPEDGKFLVTVNLVSMEVHQGSELRSSVGVSNASSQEPSQAAAIW